MSRESAGNPGRQTAPEGIFPIPRELQLAEGFFTLDASTLVAVPEEASEEDLFLARFLVAELSDRYGLGVRIERVPDVPSDRHAIVAGAATNPLVRKLCDTREAAGPPSFAEATEGLAGRSLGEGRPEEYELRVRERSVLIAGSDAPGAFYGLQSLRQLIDGSGGQARIPCVRVRDWPHKPFRGVRLYLPGSENIPFFKRFIRDFMALYKFNKLILEVNACMRLDRHPELNAGWIEFAKDLAYRRLNYPAVSEARGKNPNSSHYDTADGGVLEKDQVADLVQYAGRHHIEVIPEIPGLTHSYYLLTRHHELAEQPDEEWPDTYCPSNPKTYELMFDVFDEYIEVIRPKTVHIGHDEWFLPDALICPKCRGRDRAELYAEDVKRIHDSLSEKGIRVAMWGDHFVERLGRLGALSEDQVRERIPKDILIFNWFWRDRWGDEGAGRPGGLKGEDNDITVQQMGFEQVYGNFGPEIQNWEKRSTRDGVLGGAPSSWAATTEFNFGKDLVLDFLYCANLLWSTHWPEREALLPILQGLMPAVRRNLRGTTEPSEDGGPSSVPTTVPLLIVPWFNMAAGEKPADQDLPALAAGEVRLGNKVFALADPRTCGGKCGIVVGTEGAEPNPLAREVSGIEVDRDVSSLIFLHACARPSGNKRAYHSIFNFADTADLLGWYEIVYEDGLVETIPIRYGVNILEWGGVGLYGADVVNCSGQGADPGHFFAFEWRNPRFGKKLKAVNLRGTTAFYDCKIWRGGPDKLIANNAVVLLALSAVERKE